MIESKNFNKIVMVFLALALIFTSIFVLKPDLLGLEVNTLAPEYVNKLFDKEKISSIEIAADSTKWADMLENATAEEFIPCDITINGETFKSVGIRPKGNSSLQMVASSNSNRFSFKIKFDKYIDGQTYYGLEEMVINNMMGDATYMKEYLSYDLFEYIGIKTPVYAFTDITVNGETWGFYLAVETMEEDFVERTYGTEHGELYKPESEHIGGEGMKVPGNPTGQEMPGQRLEGIAPPEGFNQGERPQRNATGGGSDLVYTDDDADSYQQIFDNAVFKTSNVDQERVITALKALSTGEDIETYVDVDEVLRYFAVNITLVNLDSYVGNSKHNYYLYEKDGQISILPWDLNLSFAGFQCDSASEAVNFPIDTPVIDSSLSQRPLIGKLLENDEYKDIYHEQLQKIIDGYYNSGQFVKSVNSLNILIKEHVKSDSSAFYTYEQYTKAVQSLKSFMGLRIESIQGQLDGSIPSTSEGQASDPEKLIDASSVNLSDMGFQGGGRDLERPDRLEQPKLPDQPDIQ